MKILLIVYDNDSYIHWFPQGIAYIAGTLIKASYEVEIYHQDIHHYQDSHLTDYLNKNKFDVIGLSFIGGYYQYKKAKAISQAINESKNRPDLYILGGFGPSPEPEYFLRKLCADIVIIGEGELTIVELLEAHSNKRGLKNIDGIAYLENGMFYQNKRRELIQDVDSIPLPAYEMFPIEYYRLMRMPHSVNKDFIMPILSGRGCTFTCNFCYRMDKGLRIRSNEAIIEEIKYLQKNWGINYISFSDELLMSSKQRTISIAEAIIKANLNIKWECNGRLNYATLEVLKIMKKSGCVYINYGIESFDDQILKNMDKVLTTKQIVKGIEATLAEGISPGFNIIFGNIGEGKQQLMKGVDFLLKYDDHSEMRTIRPVTPYPGSPLYYYAISKGLLRDVEDFYEHKHINSDLLSVNFTDMTDDEFYDALSEANQVLLNNYTEKQKENIQKNVVNLYKNRDVGFRGFRQT